MTVSEVQQKHSDSVGAVVAQSVEIWAEKKRCRQNKEGVLVAGEGAKLPSVW